MKSLLRSSIFALVVFAGYAAVSMPSGPAAIPGSTRPTQPCGQVAGSSFCVK